MTTHRILVVDDDAAVRRTLQRALDRAGHTVILAASGEQACEILQSGTAVDVALMDLRMPTMSGRTLFQMILAQWPLLAARLAVMSGDPEAEDHAAWMSMHDLPVLPKPFSLEEVYAMIDALARPERKQANG
jgi:two-component system response regulator PrrA